MHRTAEIQLCVSQVATVPPPPTLRYTVSFDTLVCILACLRHSMKNQHEAMAMVPNPDAESNSVMEVMQKGYSLNERLVRAAKVIVTKAAES